MVENSARSDHFAALDGLRGCAALVVMVSHSANRGYLPGVLGQGFGSMGVSLFYALSGFLMAWLYLHQDFTRPNVRAFAIRRAARIVPLYYTCLFGAMLAAALFGWVVYISAAPRDFLLALAFLRGRDVLWSIPVEVQFYAIFVLLWWFRSRALFWPALIAMLAGEVAFFLLVERGYNTIFKWAHLFAFGMILALWVRSDPARLQRLAGSAVVQGASWVALLILPLCLPGTRIALGLTPLDANVDPISVGYPVALLAFGTLGAGAFRLLEAPGLRWLGQVSFGVYLLHIPALHVTDYLTGAGLLPVWAGFALVILLALGSAALLHRLVEQPARSLGRSLAPTGA